MPIPRTVALAALLAFLAACDRQPTAQPAQRETPPPSAPASPPATPLAAPPPATPSPPLPRAHAEHDATGLFEFAYSWPVAASVIPSLRTHLQADRAHLHARLLTLARSGRDEARKNGFEYHPYSKSVEWKVVTDLPAWLSLSALASAFTGGAHPNYAFREILWDKRANRRRDPLALFRSPAAFDGAIHTAFCAELDRQRAKKRGAQASTAPDDPFATCIDPAKETVILGSSNGKAFDRIGILIAPYEAGPYVEGSYEVTLPVTPAVIAALRPEYRPSFVVGR